MRISDWSSDVCSSYLRTAGRARMAAMNASVSPELDFPGRDKLVAVVDAAVAQGDEHAITAALRNGMCAMIRNGEVRLPDEVFEPLDDHYARRELYRSPEHGYSVVAMTWAPGQGTPIHDHCGLWCVEGVWEDRKSTRLNSSH